jgi:hypothetical protein
MKNVWGWLLGGYIPSVLVTLFTKIKPAISVNQKAHTHIYICSSNAGMNIWYVSSGSHGSEYPCYADTESFMIKLARKSYE